MTGPSRPVNQASNASVPQRTLGFQPYSKAPMLLQRHHFLLDLVPSALGDLPQKPQAVMLQSLEDGRSDLGCDRGEVFKLRRLLTYFSREVGARAPPCANFRCLRSSSRPYSIKLSRHLVGRGAIGRPPRREPIANLAHWMSASRQGTFGPKTMKRKSTGLKQR